MKLMTHDVSRLKWATDESVIILHANNRINHRSFLKFRKILRKCQNSAAKGKLRGSVRNSAARGKL